MRSVISIPPIGTKPVVTLEICIRAADSLLPPISMFAPAEKMKVKVDDRKKYSLPRTRIQLSKEEIIVT